MLKIFQVVKQVLICTESAVWDVSSWDLCKWGSEDGLFDKILENLEKEKPHDRGNIKDAPIGETAIRNGISLVSKDYALLKTVRKFGGVAIFLKDFLSLANQPMPRLNRLGQNQP